MFSVLNETTHTTSGMFFMRFAWAVDPRNYILFACHTTNVCAQLTQLTRKLQYDGYLDPKQINFETVKEKLMTDSKTQNYAGAAAIGASGFLLSRHIQTAVTTDPEWDLITPGGNKFKIRYDPQFDLLRMEG